MHLFTLRSLLAAALALACSVGHAHLSFSWDLDDWNPVLGPRDTLLLRAQLFNDPTSTEVLRGDRLLAALGSDVDGIYTFMDAPTPLADQLRHVVLAPGQGMDLVFGRLVPLGGQAEPGRYMAEGGFSMAFADDNGREVGWTPDHSLVVTVRDGGGNPVPEPAPLALLAVAALAAWRFRPSSPRCR